MFLIAWNINLQVFNFQNDIRSTRFFSMLCFACLMLFQLLIFCWNGNEVLVESLEIAFAAYDSDWFVCDIATQKAVVLVIQRAQRALQLSAGKFAYLTLETYMSVSIHDTYVYTYNALICLYI